MNLPDWIEIVPHTQDGKAGAIVITREVCSDGFRRGLFAVGERQTEAAVDALACHRSIGKFYLATAEEPQS